MSELGPTTKTNRGFELIEFKDCYGAPCSLQQSSLADYVQPGTSAIWLGCENNQPTVEGHDVSPRMHLNVEQVQALVTHLQKWLDEGTFT